MERFRLSDYDTLPIFSKPKEIGKYLLNVSEPTLYEILNREGCPKIPIGTKAYIIPTKKFIEWLERQAISA